MEIVHPTGWKHTTAPHIRGHDQQAGMDLFDDEDDGQFTIYIRYHDGTRFPARTVNAGDPIHAAKVLAAWSLRGEVRDYRTHKEIFP